MTPKLYKMDYSPPARAVYMTTKALGIKLDYVVVNILNMEHMKEDYLKINPQHTIPALEDNGKIIWDSHAITIYLITKYGNDDSLYPEDPYIRAIINQRLHFDSGVIFPILRRLIRSMKYKGVKTISQEVKEEILESYGFLEAFLKNGLWMAGDNPTLADLHLLATVTSAEIMLSIDAGQYPKLSEWLKRGKTLDCYAANEAGLIDFKELYESLTA